MKSRVLSNNPALNLLSPVAAPLGHSMPATRELINRLGTSSRNGFKLPFLLAFLALAPLTLPAFGDSFVHVINLNQEFGIGVAFSGCPETQP